MNCFKTNMKKKMLITGVSGLLGNNLAYYFKNKFNILGLYFTHPVIINGVQLQKVDLLNENLFKDIILEFAPDIIIHCASLTDVDFCEMNPEITDLVNVKGTQVVVDSIKKRNTKLIYISTESVYDGTKGDFFESDPVNPQNYYGLSKYKGELEVLEKKGSLILRTNIFGWNIQKKFSIAERVWNELSNKRIFNGFKDAFFSSIYTFDVAAILDKAIDLDLSGIYNCASRTSSSKYEFALYVANYFNLEKELVQPISIDDFGFKAKRGKNLTLNVTKLQNVLNYKFPSITDSIHNFHRDFLTGIPQKIKSL